MERLLVVDDEPILLKGLKFSLEQEDYVIEKSQAVDMFPQTHHVENVVLLKRRK